MGEKRRHLVVGVAALVCVLLAAVLVSRPGGEVGGPPESNAYQLNLEGLVQSVDESSLRAEVAVSRMGLEDVDGLTLYVDYSDARASLFGLSLEKGMKVLVSYFPEDHEGDTVRADYISLC